MTEAIAIPPGANVSDPYVALRQMLNQIAELDMRIKPLIEDRASLQAKATDLAGAIQKSGLQSKDFVLKGIETKKRRELDVQKLREKYPEIYQDANPYVDEKTICEILISIKPGWDLQETVRDMAPEAFHAAAKIRLTELDKAVGKHDLQKLEDDGILTTHIYTKGEPVLIRRSIVDAKPRASIGGPDDTGVDDE